MGRLDGVLPLYVYYRLSVSHGVANPTEYNMDPIMNQILNREMLPESNCFGCGLANPLGLHVEIMRDD